MTSTLPDCTVMRNYQYTVLVILVPRIQRPLSRLTEHGMGGAAYMMKLPVVLALDSYFDIRDAAQPCNNSGKPHGPSRHLVGPTQHRCVSVERGQDLYGPINLNTDLTHPRLGSFQ